MLLKIDNRQEGIILAALKLLNGMEVAEDSALHADLTRDGPLPHSAEIDTLIAGIAGPLRATLLGEIAEELAVGHNDEDSPAFISAARDRYATDDLEIDDVALCSRSDRGCFVSAWVYVTNDQAGIVFEDEGDDEGEPE